MLDSLRNVAIINTEDIARVFVSCLEGKEISLLDRIVIYEPECGVQSDSGSCLIHPIFFELLRRTYQNFESSLLPNDFASTFARVCSTSAKEHPDLVLFGNPYFLFHGTHRTEEAFLSSVRTNASILHESYRMRIALGRELVSKYRGLESEQIVQSHPFVLLADLPNADDYTGGIRYFMIGRDWSPTDVVSSIGIFPQPSGRKVYVLPVQGGSFTPNKEQRKKDSCAAQNKLKPDKKRIRFWNSFKQERGEDPRAYILRELCKKLHEQGYGEILVVKPECHPMTLEGHNGFFGTYGLVIQEAGISQDRGFYYAAELPL